MPCEEERCLYISPMNAQSEVCKNFYTPEGSCCEQCKDCPVEVIYEAPTSVIGNAPIYGLKYIPVRTPRRGKRQSSNFILVTNFISGKIKKSNITVTNY